MNQHTITITKIDGVQTIFHVSVTLANGYVGHSMSCDSEDQARVYARGLQDGFSLAKNAIDIGLRFDGTISTLDEVAK